MGAAGKAKCLIGKQVEPFEVVETCQSIPQGQIVNLGAGWRSMKPRQEQSRTNEIIVATEVRTAVA